MAASYRHALRRITMGGFQTLQLKWDEDGSTSEAYIKVNGRKYAKDVTLTIPRNAEIYVYVTANYNTNSYIALNGVEVHEKNLDSAHEYTFHATDDVEIEIRYNTKDYYRATITMPA